MLAKTKENYKWYALSCTTLGALLSVLNSNTLLIALPVIARALHASLETIIWTLMIYMLAVTVMVPAIGRVADIIGRKKLYVSGFALFTVASLLCGLVQLGGQLVAARFIQSVGGSLMLANSTAIVTDAFPKGQLGRALGINSMVIGAGAVIGPILGGLLTSWHWRWIFFFNVPLGIIGTLWAAIQLREIIELPEGQRFDWLGTSLFTIGFTFILLALTFGDMVGWHTPWIVASLVGGSLLMLLFIYIENHVDQPMLDLSLFRQRLLAAAYASNLLNGIARGAVTFLLIFFFQGIWGIDPLWAGILLTPFALAMMFVAPVSGILSDRYGSRELSSLGLAVSAIGLYGLTRLQINTPMTVVILWMVIMGLGSGFFFSPNTNAIMGAVAAERRGIAAGTRTMMNNAGMVISIALGLAMTASSMTPEAMQGLFAGTQVGSQGIAVQEFMNGLHRAFWLSFIISIVAAVVALMRGPHEVYYQETGSGSNKA
ncbi:multidrug resistance protein 3 [Moorella thermoacetica]|uniref:MFS transporter n=1 Tax=Neomoorella thermoacetica TaxID=1525 RepID=UPI00069EE183|nr:MFS transporter [Moorella thermoacetica]AKX93758.1 multidrug resistance protein 3 [Moorella thermoacetica]